MAIPRWPHSKRLAKKRRTILPLSPPPADDETIATPSAADAVTESVAVDDMDMTVEDIVDDVAVAAVEKVVNSLLNESMDPVEPVAEITASKMDTILADQEQAKGVSPNDAVVVATVEKIIESVAVAVADSTAAKPDTIPQQEQQCKDVSAVDAVAIVPASKEDDAEDPDRATREMIKANQQWDPMAQKAFVPKKKKWVGLSRLNKYEQELMRIFLNCSMDG